MNSWKGVFTNGRDILYLTLPNNNLVGVLPNLNLPNLIELYLGNNSLSGNISSLNIPAIEKLQIQNNQLTGSIPNISTGLRELFLQNNQLTGSIPNFNLLRLSSIDLGNNQLSGSIPNFNLPDVGVVRFNNNNLSGTIPNFTNFNPNILDLSNNQLSGSIPNVNFTRLYQLNLSNNKLSGNVPNFDVRICFNANLCFTNNFDISNNQFVFGDIFGKGWLSYDFTSYAPQANIPLNYNNGVLSVSTGRPDVEQTFKWYKDGQLIATNTSSQYTPTTAGTYYCRVAHQTLTPSVTGFRSTASGDRNLILESTNISVSVLPVELLSFQAQNTEGVNLLTFQTATEKNVSHFDIEKSKDGSAFVKMGELKAVGNSETIQRYRYSDSDIYPITYYRLKINDLDGKTEYSKTVSVETSGKMQVVAFPNPANNELNINVAAEPDANISIQLFDVLGRLVLQKISKNTEGVVSSVFDIEKMASGIYILKVTDGKNSVKQSISKQ